MTVTATWTDQLKRQLDDLESRIDPAEERSLRAQWVDFWEGRFTGDVFLPARSRSNPARVEIPPVHINDAQDGFAAMACSELAGASQRLNGSGCFPMVRCNYGVGILPSLFGTAIKTMERQFNLLPTSLPLGRDGALKLLDRGMPDVRRGLGGKVLDMAAFFRDAFADYPKVREFVKIYHPDLQGPMDVCELIWGSDLFVSTVDEPDEVHALLSLICDTYSALLREFARMAPFAPDYNGHWGWLLPGAIMLRDDSAMNFSPAMFGEFIRPYDERLLKEWGGGSVHYCGRGDHFVPSMATMEGLKSIHLSQPHLNDMEVIYRATVDRGIFLLMPGNEARRDAATRNMHHRLHGL